MRSRLSSDAGAPAPSRARLWLFRLLAAGLLPLALLALGELGLRLAGAGHATGFLRATERGTLVSSQRFGWRFFPRAIARTPAVFELERAKPEGLVRVVVLGGSAAMGTPEPGFGLARQLEVMLEERHPGRRFEVVNAAMTAINSHVALPIARDCARLRPDVVLVYLGNNEVVGPYGGGTVFQGSSALPLVRAGIALRSLRLAQVLEAGLRRARLGAPQPRAWKGLEMFVAHELRAGDPRLERVYRHFRRNLVDLVESARGAGARVVLSTVAVDLLDSPPFASAHGRELAPQERDAWEALYARGAFLEAAAIDDGHAELQYRLGRTELAAGNAAAARARLERARDLDVLRFRADSAINRTIREVAAERGARLYDAERRIAEHDPAGRGLPGRALFHEHVHFNLEGNRILALGALEHVEALVAGLEAPAGPAPTPERVAERLALTAFDRYDAERAILEMVSRPPFTGQLDHAADLARRRRRVEALRRGLDGAARAAADAAYRRALEGGQSLELRARFAGHLHRWGQLEEAEAQYRRLLERLPEIAAWRTARALVLADAGRSREAIAELERVEALWPGVATTRANLGSIYEKEGRLDDAAAAYERALELDPDHTVARFNLATLRFRGDELEAAEAGYRALVERAPTFAPAHHNLGGVLEQRGRLEEAVERYREAVRLDPGAAAAHNSLGLARERQGRLGEALAAYRAALEADPAYALARFNLADLLLGLGRAAEAAEHYRRGLELEPANEQARRNLELALRTGGAPGL